MLPNKGLSDEEALKRLKEHGENRLPEKIPPSDFFIFASQLKSPLVYILVAAGLVTFFLKDVSDTVIIFLAVLVNTVLGFIQERRASKALEALKLLIHPKAEVFRDGKRVSLGVEKIVPGDLVILASGSKVPGDGKVVEANRLFIDEAILTGESLPVAKEKDGQAYMGTVVAAGRGMMVIEKTGGETSIGKIAESIQEKSEETPLKRKLSQLAKDLSLVVLALTFIVFVVGLVRGRGLVEIFTTSVALAVSAIPEGLLVGLTVVLAIGMQRILKRKGLVRHLVSAETLGGVTTICVDKTGTLTEGKMQVVEVVGREREIAESVSVANDEDDPIVIAALDWALQVRSGQAIIKKHPRLDSIPFSPNTRFFACLNKWDKQSNVLYVNGAPELILGWSKIGKAQKDKFMDEVDRITQNGRRVIGLARKFVGQDKKEVADSDTKDLEFLGLLAFSDPVRSGVKTALEETKSAGIRVVVITGDYKGTAVSVLKELGMEVGEEEILEGVDLLKLNKEELKRKLSGEGEIKLFARTTPEQKLKIIEALKEAGEVVAMMGDGVNDAPALKKADIGIVVGEATDVAKETADLILLDSSFETIIAAIEEGRGIFDNVRKIVLYLLSDAFEEIVAVLGTLVLGLPLPVSAAQILWINLVSDGFPDLALTVDPKEKGIMNRNPRPKDEKVVTGWMRSLILVVSLTGGLFALFLFIFFYRTTADYELARSIAFATLGVNSLVYVFSIRGLTKPFWQESPFKNSWLNLAVVAGLILQVAPFVVSPLGKFLAVKALSPFQWLLVFSASVLMFIMIEVIKSGLRLKKEW